MNKTAREQMDKVIGSWLKALDSESGWKENQRKKVMYCLFFDDPVSEIEAPEEDFQFSSVQLEREHEVVMHYLELQDTLEKLKQCEYYFRRFPFRGLPVTRKHHLINICEMYFNRIYEFKERLKKYFKVMKDAVPNHQLDIGVFIKLFSKEFDSELSERNMVHHHRGFGELDIERIMLLGIGASYGDGKWGGEQYHMEYRKVSKEWAQRVRTNSKKLDQFLEAVAKATLENCKFLSE